MYHPTAIALFAADLALLLLIIRLPLSRRFDDSDRGAGRIVKLPPIRRPSVPRALAFLLVGAAVSVLIVALRHPQLDQAYRAVVADTLSAADSDTRLTAMYANSLPPLVPAAVVGYLVTIALVLPATIGRRLVILAHAPVFVAMSVLTEVFTALVGAATGLPLGPAPLLALVLQTTLGYLLVYRLSFTAYQLPRLTPLPNLRRGDWPDNLVLACCLVATLSLVGGLALALVEQVGGHPVAQFLVLASLRFAVTDVTYALLGLVRLSTTRRPRLGPERPALNVIIPAYNEAAGIERLLRSIDRAAEAYGGPVHVVMCDDGSTDDTRALAEAVVAGYRHATGVVIQGAHAGKAKALNLALERCTADYVYRVDADCALDTNAFVHTMPHFLSDPRVGTVGLLTLPKEPYATWIDRMRAMEQLFTYGYSLACVSTVDGVPCIPGTFCGFRRAPVAELGGFVHGMFGEDAEFTCALARLGWRAVLDPRGVSYEDVPATVGQLRVQRFRWGLGNMMTFARFTPFGQGAPGPRFWFQLPRAAGGKLAYPIHFFVLILTVLYGVLHPGMQHNVPRFLVVFVLAQLPALLPRLCVILYYRRWRLLVWAPLFIAFAFLKRFFQLESLLACGTRPVRLPPAIRALLPAPAREPGTR
ncbi:MULTISPECIES: glycosyltransferase [Kitasatospora]|uniref:glycosyltransferase n=1 Tax=Kitasatospora TaxID=2063 RepID=UPI000C715157|nr:glycosyltransferase [Kitasatospora sp. GP30]MDH6140438.1 cellulose synthase/poly-beta-1,6-N-acetylglucosamine synthase-like glycosyltransferase [Kitasatospora sp. GP30]